MERHEFKTRPPRMKAPPALPRGPDLYRITKQNTVRRGGPGDPPPGFVGATNSAVEWVAYWALWKALGLPGDPRVPPFSGFPNRFVYQSPFEGGRHEGPGGQVVDFVVWQGPRVRNDVGIRIQTEHFHYRTTSFKQATDRILKARLAGRMDVADVYDYELMADPSGQAAVVTMKRVLAGQRPNDPLLAGTVQRLRAA